MNKTVRIAISVAITLAGVATTVSADDTARKPLKIFVLVGQSNMEGHAHVDTFKNLSMEPGAEPEMLKEMTNEDGTPKAVEDVYISYCTGDVTKPELVEKIKEGNLTVGYGAQYGAQPKIGPEYTFGIYMRKHLQEPILIIKVAWGGKSLFSDFRPPSAGPYVFNEGELNKIQSRGQDVEQEKAKKAKITGYYYRLMVEHVNKVLADPGKVHPAYDPKVGYELAGFVWFQGWNDATNGIVYPQRGKPGGYDMYSELLADFIRDVRKDFKAPDMPFVIGVMGTGGDVASRPPDRYTPITLGFREAMAAPARLPEFKDNVIAVQTYTCWDEELASLDGIFWKVTNGELETAMNKLQEERGDKKISAGEREALRQSLLKEAMGDRYEYFKTGASNKSFHYLGSAKILGRIGKAFADALAEWHARH